MKPSDNKKARHKDGLMFPLRGKHLEDSIKTEFFNEI